MTYATKIDRIQAHIAEPLADWVASYRRLGESWAGIANLVHATTGYSISAARLCQLFKDDTAADASLRTASADQVVDRLVQLAPRLSAEQRARVLEALNSPPVNPFA